MTIEAQRPRDRDCFLRREKKFFPQKCHLGHEQLKHFLSCPQTGRVYLVNRRNIYCIDTERCKRTFVTELPFEARCTATGYGWLCVGGEDHGYFASVRIPDGVPHLHRAAGGGSSSSDNEVDASGGEEGDSSGTDTQGASSGDYWHRFEHVLSPHIKIERLGDLLINSISIHRLERVDGQYEVIALVTNNDSSVRIWSLTNQVEFEFDSSFPFPMNHATISPDGKLLVVVGDQEWAYLYQRYDQLPVPADPTSLFRWERFRDLALHKPAGTKHSEYFTTAWSPNGMLLATASQQGYITVFDVETLRDVEADRDPVIAVTPSSRTSSSPGPGAVRTMCFAPEPWDLLLWTENNGRLGIGDLRTGLATRQIVDLDPAASDVQTVDLAEVDVLLEGADDRHDEAGRDGNARNALVRDYSAALLQERRQQVGIQSFTPGLTEEEWQRLDMLRTARQQEEAVRRGRDVVTSNVRNLPVPYSIRYDTDADTTRPDPARARSGLAWRTDAVMDYMRSYVRDRPGGIGSTRSEQLPQLRRRRSVVMTAMGDGLTATMATAAENDPWRTIEAAIDRAVVEGENEAMEDILNGPTENAAGESAAAAAMDGWEGAGFSDWHDRLAALGRLRDLEGHDRPEQHSEGTAAQAEAAQQRHIREIRARQEELLAAQSRQRMRPRDRDLYANGSLGAQRRLDADDIFPSGLRNSIINSDMLWRAPSADGLETTGVAWDLERRVVYAGTVDGVFELKMNFHERKFWPSVEMR